MNTISTHQNNSHKIKHLLKKQHTDNKSIDQKQKSQSLAFKEFFKTINSIQEEEITDREIKVLENNRINFTRKIDL